MGGGQRDSGRTARLGLAEPVVRTVIPADLHLVEFDAARMERVLARTNPICAWSLEFFSRCCVCKVIQLS